MKNILIITMISLVAFIAFSKDITTLVGETTLMIYAIGSLK